MRIFSSTLVFLASLALTLTTVVGAADGLANDGDNKKLSQSEGKSMDAKQDGHSKVFSFSQSGGFIGVHRKYEKALSELSAGEREQLEKLIASSGLLQVKREERITAGAADMFQYEFSFKDGSNEHHVTFDDGSLPNSYKPLVQFLKDKAVDQRHH